MIHKPYHRNLNLKTRILNIPRRLFQSRFIESLLIKLTDNQLPSSFWARLIPSEYLYKPGSERTFVRNGLKYQLDISHVVDHFIYYGLKDPAYDNLISIIKPEDIIIDVGANIGRFACPFASAAINGNVYCFEPDSENFKRLSLNTELNQLKNIYTFNRGLGSYRGNFRLYRIDANNPGMNRILNGNQQNDLNFELVSISKLDDEVSDLKLKKVDVIKIDVEGFEFEVLKGASETIDNFKPVLFIEISDENLRVNGVSAEDMLEWIKCKDYKIYNAANSRMVLQNDLERQFDALCIPSVKH